MALGVSVSIEHGNTPETVTIYNLWAALLGHTFGDLESSREFGELALALDERLGAAHAALGRVKPDAVLVNTGGGGVADEAALVAALQSGRLGGAVLDVFEEEPLSAAAGARFAGLPNLILTPHGAGLTEESNHRLSAVTVESVLRVLNQDQRELP